MFCKLFVLAALLAFAAAAPKPGFLAAPAYTTYSAGIGLTSPLAYGGYSGFNYAPSYGFSYGLGLGGFRGSYGLGLGFGRGLFY